MTMTTAWKLTISTGALVLAGALGACTDPYEPAGSGSEEPELFGNEDCLAKADELYRENPSIYYSRQEAYDGCRRAGDLVDELSGSIVTQP